MEMIRCRAAPTYMIRCWKQNDSHLYTMGQDITYADRFEADTLRAIDRELFLIFLVRISFFQ